MRVFVSLCRCLCLPASLSRLTFYNGEYRPGGAGLHSSACSTSDGPPEQASMHPSSPSQASARTGQLPPSMSYVGVPPSLPFRVVFYRDNPWSRINFREVYLVPNWRYMISYPVSSNSRWSDTKLFHKYLMILRRDVVPKTSRLCSTSQFSLHVLQPHSKTGTTRDLKISKSLSACKDINRLNTYSGWVSHNIVDYASPSSNFLASPTIIMHYTTRYVQLLLISMCSAHIWTDWPVSSSKSWLDWTLVLSWETFSPGDFTSSCSTSWTITRTLSGAARCKASSAKIRPVTLMLSTDAPQQLWSATLPNTQSMKVLKNDGARTYPCLSPLFI